MRSTANSTPTVSADRAALPLAPGALRELFRHNDWATEKLFALATPLADDALDRPFAMGPGSLRRTLHHAWGAEWIWLERWHGRSPTAFPATDNAHPLSALADHWRATAADRNRLLDTTTAADTALARIVNFSTTAGDPSAIPLGSLMLHVAVHGIHHRAQALNMLRQLGVKVPWLDYLAFRVARPTLPVSDETAAFLRTSGMPWEPADPPPLELATICTFLHYHDWAQSRVLAAAEPLTAAQADQPFDIGPGSVRKTLAHLAIVDQFWFGNWHDNPQMWQQYPEPATLADVRAACAEWPPRRNDFVATLTDHDLQRPVPIQPFPGGKFEFRLGDSLLQIAAHGVHHRAQILNMLRQLGLTPPTLDVIAWLRGA